MNIKQVFAMCVNRADLFYGFVTPLLICFFIIAPQDALALTKPTLLSPINNIDVTTSSFNFSWSHPYNDEYEIKIKTSGGTLKYASGKISSKERTVNLSGIPLSYGSTYKWYVVVYANGQEEASDDGWFTYKFTGRVDVSGGVNVSPGTVTVGQEFTVSFDLREFQGGTKTFEYVELWIQDGGGNDLYVAQHWDNVSFSPNEQRSFSATTYLDPAHGRGAGDYRAIVKGKFAGDGPFNFGVVGGSGAVNPRGFSAVLPAGRVDVSGGVNVSPGTVTVGQEFAVSFDLREFQGGTKTFEYVELWIQDGGGNDLYAAQHWDNVSFSPNEQRSFSATTYLDPAHGRGAGDYRAIVKGKFAGDGPFNFGVVGGSGAVNPRGFNASISSAVTPGSVSVSPDSGNWTDTPHDLSVTSGNATIIYYTMVNTYDGSTPADPRTPSASSSEGSISGPTGIFRLFASSGQTKHSKLRFIGCNNTACGSASPVFSYTQIISGSTETHNPPPDTADYGSTINSGAAAEPVNTATGNYYYQHTDLKLPGRGLPFVFTRTYNDQDSYMGPLGRGWTHSYNARLTEQTDASVVIKQGDGHDEFYDPNGDGSYKSRYLGLHSRLVKNADNTFTLTAKDQTRQDFGADGKLTAIRDRNGNALSFAYDNAGNLTAIIDTVSRTLALSYDASNRLVQIADPIGRKIQYAYDDGGHLISDTDPAGGTMSYVYNANHHIAKIADRRGNTLIENTYDAQGRVISQKNGRGLVTAFAYDSPNAGDTTITDPLGHKTIHTHDNLRRLIKETDALGHAVQYVYDADNNRTQITDKSGNVTSFIYDPEGNLILKNNEPNQVTTIEYDAFNNPTKRVDALSQATTFEYDGKGNLTKATDPLGKSTVYTYDAFGQPLTVTDALGHTATNVYDAQGNLAKVTDALGHETAFTYDSAGRRLSAADAKGRTTSFAYDGNDKQASVTDLLGNVTASVYDANGNRARVTDARGGVTNFAYDANDLLISVTDALSGTTAYTYNDADHRASVTDARGNKTTFAYDAAGRMIAATDALGKTTQFAYDANGNLTAATNPLGHTTAYAYDALGHRVGTTDALGYVTQIAYDALGRVISRIDAKGRVTAYTYDALGRLTQVTDPASGTVSYTYDAVGNKLTFTDPNGHVATFGYDALNRLTDRTDPLGHTYHFAYDEAGNLAERTDASNQKTAYQYDGNNHLTRIDYPNAGKVQFGYDETGNRIQMIDSVGTGAYAYDALNRLTQSTDGYGQTVGYEYDAAGNRTALVYPDGKRVSYAYDALNRMAKVTDWLGGVTAYAYDAAGNLASGTLPNGAQASYAYDNAERLIQLANAKPDASVLASYTLTLDAVGNRTGVDRTEPLAPVFASRSDAYAHDTDNRLTQINGSVVTHDPNGNLTAGPDGDYAFDFEDRLINAPDYLYVYDGAGRRLQRTNGIETTRYALDIGGALTQVLAESDGAGNPKAYYVYGLGLISRIASTGEARYYHYDPIGSTVALTDLNGQTTDRYAYDPFGVPLASDGVTSNPFRYVGQHGLMHEGNGLYYVRARYYDPALGRFINKDPFPGDVGDGQGLHRYTYGVNNPVRFVDVSGLSIKEMGSQYGSDMPHQSIIATKRHWSSEEAHQRYLNALRQSQQMANEALQAQEDYIKTIDRIYAIAKNTKIATDTIIGFVSIFRPEFNAYSAATHFVEAAGLGYQVATDDLTDQEAIVAAGSLTIDLIGEKAGAAVGASYLGKFGEIAVEGTKDMTHLIYDYATPE
jgi:RHS repeat-associated protein